MNDLDHFNAPKMGGKASPALCATPRCQADRVPYLFCWTQGACFGVRQLAAALNRAELPPRQLAAVASAQQKPGIVNC